MGAVVGVGPGVPAQGVIPTHLAARRAQTAEVRVGGTKAAEGIDNDAHLNTGGGLLGERSQHLVANLSWLEFVEFEVDGLFRPADGFELRRVKLDSVLEPRDARMAQSAIGHDAKKLNELVGVESGLILVRHGIGNRRAEVIQQEASRKEKG